jgi:hypothetical protein
MFYCAEHGRVYCIDCDTSIREKAEARVLATRDRAEFAACYQCDAPAVRACTRCGRCFCERHGGLRWVWSSLAGRSTLTKQVVCDACTPNSTWMAFTVTLMVIFFVAVLGLILYMFSQVMR